MSRQCTTCQHVKRVDIDRRLAAGEPGNKVAADYGVSRSSLHRHRINCLKLGAAGATMKEIARGTAALACLPSREELGSSYLDLCGRIDQIVTQAEREGSLKIALAGLNSVRQTIDSLARLSGADQSETNVNVSVATRV